MEKFPVESEENEVEGAAQNAGLYDVELPRVGTRAYEALMETARKYLETIKMIEGFRTKKGAASGMQIGTLEQERRRLHDQLCLKLEGKHEDELDTDEKEKITNFAAYLMREEDYVIQHKSQSQVSYFRDLNRE